MDSATFRIQKVNFLPSSNLRSPNTIYLVRSGTGFDIYCTASDSTTAYKSNVEVTYDDLVEYVTNECLPANLLLNTGEGLTGGGELINNLTIELSLETLEALEDARTALQPGDVTDIGDAPSDGTPYGRQNGAWVSVVPDLNEYETVTQLNARSTSDRSRANHTGTQAISTIDGLQAILDSLEEADPTILKTADIGVTVQPFGNYVTEAPIDANVYGRMGGQWVAMGEGNVVGLDPAVLNNYETITQLNVRSTADRDRTNHTGTQAISTITGLQTALDGKQANIVSGTTEQYYRGDKSWQTLNKAAVGLSNVDNTSDLDKPISTATQSALNSKEASIAVGTTSQYYRGDKTWQTLDKTVVGLNNVDNTTDLDKPISTAVSAALENKEDLLITATTAHYYRGDKSWQILNKQAVGLPNVDNTSDLSKPISAPTQTALDGKQNVLVSGENIKTVNNISLLGSGNINISGGSSNFYSFSYPLSLIYN